MTKNLLVLNCNESLVERLRTEMGGEVEITHCRTFEELRQAWQKHRHAKVVVGCNGHAMPAMTVARERERIANGLTAVGESDKACATAIMPEEMTLADEFRHATLADQVDYFERQIIAQTLERNGQHRKDTAAELGISRVTLYNKMKKFG